MSKQNGSMIDDRHRSSIIYHWLAIREIEGIGSIDIDMIHDFESAVVVLAQESKDLQN